MAKFMITLYEISAHTFTVDALTEAAAVELARAEFDGQLDADSSPGLDRTPIVASLFCDLVADSYESIVLNQGRLTPIGLQHDGAVVLCPVATICPTLAN